MPVISGWPGSRVLVTTIRGLSPSMLRTAAARPPTYMKKSSLSRAPYSMEELLCTTLSVPESASRNTSSIGSPQNPLP